MSISLKQLSAMADIAETLATEMRELIALREIVATRSAEQLRDRAPECDFEVSFEARRKPDNLIPLARSVPA